MSDNSEQAGLLPILVDRSRIESAQKCPRLRYLAYEHAGIGIQRANPLPPPWELMTGSAIHLGLESLISRAASDAGEAASLARGGFFNGYADVAIAIGKVEDERVREILAWELGQQLDLVEALVYAWGRVRYSQWIAAYEPVPLGIEKEEVTNFTLDLGSGPRVVSVMTRVDTLAKVRGTESSYTLFNFKSTKEASDKWRKQFANDLQSMMEVVGVETRLAAEGKPAEVNGVIVEGLIKGAKGQEDYPPDSGHYQHNNSLIWAWYRAGEAPLPDEFYPKYRWKDASEIDSKTGKPKGHQVPKGSYKRLVREAYPGGIRAWIEYLLATQPSIVEEYFVSLPAVTRSAYRIEQWKRQQLTAEVRMAEAAAEINWLHKEHPGNRRIDELLDLHFPMHTANGNCLWPRQCEMYDICWGSANPDDPSLFKPRVCNHLLEAQVHGQKPAGARDEALAIEVDG